MIDGFSAYQFQVQFIETTKTTTRKTKEIFLYNNNNNNLNIFMQDCCFSFKKKTAINAGPVKKLKMKK